QPVTRAAHVDVAKGRVHPRRVVRHNAHVGEIAVLGDQKDATLIHVLGKLNVDLRNAGSTGEVVSRLERKRTHRVTSRLTLRADDLLPGEVVAVNEVRDTGAVVSTQDVEV